MRPGTGHKIERAKEARLSQEERQALGDQLRESEMARPIQVTMAVSPKFVLDLLPTAMILDYLKTERGVKVRKTTEARGGA